MALRHAICSAVLVASAASGAAAQEKPDVAAPAVDVSKLGVDVDRIRRQLVRVTVREEREGTSLRYMVDVFAQAPSIDLFPSARVDPNYWTGPTPYGAPTHREFLMLNTPIEHRGSAAGGANIGALFNWLSDKARGEKTRK